MTAEEKAENIFWQGFAGELIDPDKSGDPGEASAIIISRTRQALVKNSLTTEMVENLIWLRARFPWSAISSAVEDYLDRSQGYIMASVPSPTKPVILALLNTGDWNFHVGLRRFIPNDRSREALLGSIKFALSLTDDPDTPDPMDYNPDIDAVDQQ